MSDIRAGEKQRALNELREIRRDCTDRETASEQAKIVICRLLEALGHGSVARAYARIE